MYIISFVYRLKIWCFHTAPNLFLVEAIPVRRSISDVQYPLKSSPDQHKWNMWLPPQSGSHCWQLLVYHLILSFVFASTRSSITRCDLRAVVYLVGSAIDSIICWSLNLVFPTRISEDNLLHCDVIQSITRQDTVGAVEASDWYTRHTILNSTRLWTGSQWSWCNTGMMWSRRRVLVGRRAAVFCTDWTFRRRYSGTPYNSDSHQSRRHAINVGTILVMVCWFIGGIPKQDGLAMPCMT